MFLPRDAVIRRSPDLVMCLPPLRRADKTHWTSHRAARFARRRSRRRWRPSPNMRPGRISSEVCEIYPVVILLRSYDDEGARIAAAVAVAAGAEGLAAVGPLDDGAAPGPAPRRVIPLLSKMELPSPTVKVPAASETTLPTEQCLIAAWMLFVSSFPEPRGLIVEPHCAVRFGMPPTESIPAVFQFAQRPDRIEVDRRSDRCCSSAMKP